MEEWKSIPGYEGLYEVSNNGNVRNVRRNKLLKLSKNCYGYIQVYLYKNGIRTGLKVHRLVAQSFIPNPDNLPQINHKDEVKSNNMVDNLEWCDAKYNINYGTMKERVRKTKIEKGYWNEDVFISSEYQKKYREKHKEELKEYNKEYYQNHKEELKVKHIEYQRKWRDKNRDHCNEWQRKYRLKKEK